MTHVLHIFSSAEALVFDYGGTLDTGGRHWSDVFWQSWQHAGITADAATFRQAYVTAERTLQDEGLILPDMTFRQTLDLKLRLQLDAAGCPQALRHSLLDECYAVACQHTAYSRRVLARLKQNYRLALVSNFYGNLGSVLSEFALNDMFECVVESVSAGIRKPDPQIFLLCARQLSVSPEAAVVVGDSLSNDIRPAHTAGFRTVWLRGPQWDSNADGSCAGTIIDHLDDLI